MTTSTKVRVAAVQFGAGNDVAVNLATTLRMIDEAAKQRPDLMVLPEFINHCAWYSDHDHAYKVAVALDDEFVNAVAAKAREHRCYIKINCTVQRTTGKITGTNLLFDPEGNLIGVTDKQTLMGNENNFMERAAEHGPINDTPLGRLGMYCCADGLLNETARLLAIRGAQVLLNSLNSFAACEAGLHVPVRAAENRVFVVAANKVDYLLPKELLEPVAQRMKLRTEVLQGAGESQIVAPDGTVLAKAPHKGEAVVVAEIDVTQADYKKRPDGTDVITSRRPELYAAIAQQPGERNYQPGAAAIDAAVFQSSASGAAAITEAVDAVKRAAVAGVSLIVLPELFCFENSRVSAPVAAAARSQDVIQHLSAALLSAQKDCHIVTSLVMKTDAGFQHTGVLIGRDGVLLAQPQLHRSERHTDWCNSLGNELKTIDLPWGRMAIIVGDDSIYPETFRLAAIQNVEVVAVPLTLLERWEMEFGLLERAAENRLSVVAASRPNAALNEYGASAILTVGEDFTLWTEWKNRPFDGNISYPLITRASLTDRLTRAAIFPANAGNRMVSQKTDLVDGRPWWLLQPLVEK